MARRLLELVRYCGWFIASAFGYIFGVGTSTTSYAGRNGIVYHNPGLPFNWRNAFVATMIVVFLVELIRAIILKIICGESIYSNLG